MIAAAPAPSIVDSSYSSARMRDSASVKEIYVKPLRRTAINPLKPAGVHRVVERTEETSHNAPWSTTVFDSATVSPSLIKLPSATAQSDGTSTAPSSNESPSIIEASSNRFSNNAKPSIGYIVGYSVGYPLGFLVIGGVSFLLIRKSRRRRSPKYRTLAAAPPQGVARRALSMVHIQSQPIQASSQTTAPRAIEQVSMSLTTGPHVRIPDGAYYGPLPGRKLSSPPPLPEDDKLSPMSSLRKSLPSSRRLRDSDDWASTAPTLIETMAVNGSKSTL